MAEEKPTEPVEEKEAPATPAPTPKKSAARKGTAKPESPAAEKKKEAPKHPKAPRRPTLDPEAKRLLEIRHRQDVRRPKFTRQASYRYWRIGRWESWRRPRGLQSKQRRHYGYRSTVVSVGFGSPAATRGLTPTGFRPILIRTAKEIESLDVHRDAVLIARTVGTRRRLVLEEEARRRGLHILNPIVEDRGEE